MNYDEHSLAQHRKLKGKLEVRSKVPINSIEDLSTYYTPGIAAVSRAIAADPAQEWELLGRGNLVAVITDGSAVLGLGNIGPAAAQPVMEGKAVLLKEFAGVDTVPIVLGTQDTDTIIATVRAIAPTFGAINLEDIAAPRCFAIEDALQDLGIPVMHDDQHGTAVVVSAGLLNAAQVTGRDLSKARVVVSGAGAAGTAIIRMLQELAPGISCLVLDSKGIISRSRTDLNAEKLALLEHTNPENISGGLEEALSGADIFIGVSAPNLLQASHVARMAKDPIIFALANPVPEIYPDVALAAGAAVVATGRSDFPNQVNNVLAFPGIFRGALDAQATKITRGMLHAAVLALSKVVGEPVRERILPSPLDKTVVTVVAQAVADTARREGVVR